MRESSRLERAFPLFLSIVLSAVAGADVLAVPCPLPSFGPLRAVAPGLEVLYLKTGDFDGNGKVDLLVQTTTGINLILGAGGGEFLAPRLVPVRGGGLAAVGDFNGDGHLDAVVVHNTPQGGSSATVSVLLGDGLGGFVETGDSPVNANAIVAVVSGDFDGDGKMDVVLTGSDLGDAAKFVLCFLKGDGSGSFRVAVPRSLDAFGGLAGLVAADFDRDGNLDVAYATSGWHCGSGEVLLGDGHGGFPRSIWRVGGPILAVGDLNGDGIPDIVDGCEYALAFGVDLGTGSSFVSGGGGILRVHNQNGGGNPIVADFDGDGHADILINGYGSAIFRGDGKGGLGPPVDVSTLQTEAAFDLDGDGLPDLLQIDDARHLYVSLNDCRNLGSLETRFVVPYLLDAPGAAGSEFRSGLTILNRGKTTAYLESHFSTILAGPSGFATTTLSAGTQWRPASFLPHSFDLPEGLGFGFGFGNPWGGMFRLKFSGLTSAGDIGVMARIRSTTNGTDFGGVAFPAVPLSETLTGPSWIGWLRETAGDRTNLAVLNPGDDADGKTVLRVTLTSTDPAHPGSTVLPDFHLLPGGLVQVNRVLSTSGLGASSGFATVERIGGTAPYWTYAVVNDEANADGSIVAPLRSGARAGQSRLVLPVLVESGPFTSELVVTNASAATKHLRFEWVAEAVDTADRTARFPVDLAPGEQLYAPSFVQWLRDRNVAGVGSFRPGFAGALFVTVDGGDADGLFVGARTSAPGKIGRYGVFYPALAPQELAAGSVWLYALRQDAGNRTNVALVNAGEPGTGADAFRIEIYDGTTGVLAATVDDVRVDARGWKQLGSILAEAAPGVQDAYARITRMSGTAPFLAYAVVNDGSGLGLGTGDGSYIPMTVEAP